MRGGGCEKHHIKNIYINTCCASAVSQQEEQNIQDVYILQKAVAVAAKVKTKVTGLAWIGLAWLFCTLFRL